MKLLEVESATIYRRRVETAKLTNIKGPPLWAALLGGGRAIRASGRVDRR
jgi:hypothetical protein